MHALVRRVLHPSVLIGPMVVAVLTGQTLVTSRTMADSGAPTGIATDSNGFVFVTGVTDSPDLASVFLLKLDPHLGQTVFAANLGRGTTAHIALDSAGDVYIAGVNASKTGGYVTKVSGADHSTIYSASLDGMLPAAIAVDANGNAVVAGSMAADVPCKKPMPILGTYSESSHAFAARLNADGSGPAFTKTLGGSCGEDARAVAVDSGGNVYVAGTTYSPDFPVTPDAMIGAFPAYNISGFVSKISPDGGQLLYSSFFGGGSNNGISAMVLDGQGGVYLAGFTQAQATPGAYQPTGLAGCPPIIGIGPGRDNSYENDAGFVARMALSAAPPQFLARIGASCYSGVNTLAVDSGGNLWVTGSIGSSDLPTMAPIADLGLSAAGAGAFVAELDPTGSTLLFASETASMGQVAAGRGTGTSVYFTQGTGSVYVAQIDGSQHPAVELDSIQHYGQQQVIPWFTGQFLAPGQVVRLDGRGMGPAGKVAIPQATGLPFSLAGVQVAFNGIPAPIASVQANEIVCVSPFALAASGTVSVQGTYNNQLSNAFAIAASPQSIDLVALVNSDGSLNTADNPAKVGSLVTVYLTGVGQTIPAGVDGAIHTTPAVAPQIMPVVSANGALLQPSFFGAAVGQVAGVMQANLFVPSADAGLATDYFQIGGGGSSLAPPVYGTIYVAR